MKWPVPAVGERQKSPFLKTKPLQKFSSAPELAFVFLLFYQGLSFLICNNSSNKLLSSRAPFKSWPDFDFFFCFSVFYRCPPYHEKRCSSNPPLYTNAHCIWSYKVSIEVVFCKCNEGHFGMAGVLGCLKAAGKVRAYSPCAHFT